MCGRFTGFTFEEMLDAARQIQRDMESRQLELPLLDANDAPVAVEVPPQADTLFPDLEPVRHDSFPGSVVPVAFASSSGVGVAHLNWGYRVPWNKGPVFNARIETALAPERNMWSESLQRRRCLIAAHAFFEPAERETTISPRTGKTMKRQYRFALPNGEPLYLAAVYEGDSFSIMTCEPNCWVAPVHPRMPIALRPGEAPLWLTTAYHQLFDRSTLQLESCPM